RAPWPPDALTPYYLLRHAEAGNRHHFTDTTNADSPVGFQGQLTDRVSVDFGLRRTDYRYMELGRGYIVGSLANEAANRGDYDLSDPYGADPDVLSSIQATTSRDSRWITDEIFGSVYFDIF